MSFIMNFVSTPVDAADADAEHAADTYIESSDRS